MEFIRNVFFFLYFFFPSFSFFFLSYDTIVASLSCCYIIVQFFYVFNCFLETLHLLSALGCWVPWARTGLSNRAVESAHQAICLSWGCSKAAFPVLVGCSLPDVDRAYLPVMVGGAALSPQTEGQSSESELCQRQLRYPTLPGSLSCASRSGQVSGGTSLESCLDIFLMWFS